MVVAFGVCRFSTAGVVLLALQIAGVIGEHESDSTSRGKRLDAFLGQQELTERQSKATSNVSAAQQPQPFGLSELQVSSSRSLLTSEDRDGNQMQDSNFARAASVETEDEALQGNRCRGKKFLWMAKINAKCRRKFGSASKWDMKKTKRCLKGLMHCHTHLYVECCSQPEGPKDLETYCDTNPEDPACMVQPAVEDIKKKANVIMFLLDPLAHVGEAPPPPPTTKAPPPTTTTLAPTTTTPAADDDDDDDAGAQDGAPAPSPHGTGAPADGQVDTQADAQAIAQAVTCTCTNPSAGTGYTCSDGTSGYCSSTETCYQTVPFPKGMGCKALDGVSGPAAVPAAAPGAAPAPAHYPFRGIVAALPPLVEGQGQQGPVIPSNPVDLCADFQNKINDIESDIAELRAHLPSNEQKKLTEEDDDKGKVSEAAKDMAHIRPEKDPELNQRVVALVKLGATLKRLHKACIVKGEDGDEDDDDGGDDDSGDDDTDEDVKVDESVLDGVYNFTVALRDDVHALETKVHPHGWKWWRYRFEYSAIESLILVPLMLLIWFINWSTDRVLRPVTKLLGSTADVFVHSVEGDLDEPNPEDLVRYYMPWFECFIIYLIQHLASITIVMMISWILMLFGFYDFLVWAQNGNKSVGDYWDEDEAFLQTGDPSGYSWWTSRLTLQNLPFEGSSYYFTISAVLFHLLGATVLYSWMGMTITHKWAQIVLEQKLEEEQFKRALTRAYAESKSMKLTQEMSRSTLSTLEQLQYSFMVRAFQGPEYSKAVVTKYEARNLAWPAMGVLHSGREVTFTLMQSIQTRSFAHVATPRGFGSSPINRAMKDFPFYRYIHEVHSEAVMFLLQTSFWNFLVLLLLALCGWFFAVTLEFPAEYFFLPSTLAFFIVMLIAWFLARFYMRKANLFNESYLTKSQVEARDTATYDFSKPWISAPLFMRVTQLLLFVLCYGAARLLLSFSFWQNHYGLEVALILCLVALYFVIKLVIARTLSLILLALSLPPNASPEEIANHIHRMPRTVDMENKPLPRPPGGLTTIPVHHLSVDQKEDDKSLTHQKSFWSG